MLLGLPGGSNGKESARSKEDLGLIPVFMPGEFHGQRSQAGYSPSGHKESDMTECLNTAQGKEGKQH